MAKAKVIVKEGAPRSGIKNRQAEQRKRSAKRRVEIAERTIKKLAAYDDRQRVASSGASARSASDSARDADASADGDKARIDAG